MKKLIILVSILALTASGMVFGQLTYQGKVYYGALSNFDDAPGMGWDIRSIFTAKVDDFNTAQMRIRMRNFANTAEWAAKYPGWSSSYLLSSDAPFIDRAFLTTDIGKAFGLGADVGIVMNSGFYWVYLDDLTDGVSPFEVADLTQMDLGSGGKQAVFDLNMKFAKMVDVRATVAPNDAANNTGGWKVVGGASIPVGDGSLYPQFTFGAPSGVKAGEGTIIIAAKYAQKAGDLAFTVIPQFRYNLDSDVNGGNMAAPAPKYVSDNEAIQYYVGVAGMVQFQKLLTAKFGYYGYDGSMANRAELNVCITPVPTAGLEVGTILNLDQDEWALANGDKSALQVIDIGAFVMAGKTRFKAGYIALGKEGFADSLNHDLSEVGRNGSCCKQGGMYFETLVSF